MFSYHENIHRENFSPLFFSLRFGAMEKSLNEKKKSFQNEKTLYSHLSMYTAKEEFFEMSFHTNEKLLH